MKRWLLELRNKPKLGPMDHRKDNTSAWILFIAVLVAIFLKHGSAFKNKPVIYDKVKFQERSHPYIEN